MAERGYKGKLFKFGDFEFPPEFIEWSSFKPKPNQRQDEGSFTNGNGVTELHPVPHTKTEVSFTTLAMPESAYMRIMDNITGNYIDHLKRDANCKYYDTEHFVYKTGHFYLDPSFQTVLQGVKDGELWYGAMNWLFIEL